MENSIYTRLSQAISYAFHPFVIPAIAVALLLFGPTVMANLSEGMRAFILGVIALNTLILPAFSLALLKLFGVLPDLGLRNQKQRMLPMGIVAVCYMLCILSLQSLTAAFLINRFLIAALCCVVVAFVVNLYWKISLHMTAFGGLIGMMLVMNYAGLADFRTALIAFLLLGGALGSARLILGSHSPAQIGTGALTGIAITVATILWL